jgi:hypothetical protein
MNEGKFPKYMNSRDDKKSNSVWKIRSGQVVSCPDHIGRVKKIKSGI